MHLLHFGDILQLHIQILREQFLLMLLWGMKTDWLMLNLIYLRGYLLLQPCIYLARIKSIYFTLFFFVSCASFNFEIETDWNY